MNTLNQLTQQEHRILMLVAKGRRNARIASDLCISTRTVENHLYHIFSKLGVSSRIEAALYALQTGMVSGSEMSRNSQDRESHNNYSMDVR